MTKYIFKLYVAGKDIKSKKAIRKIHDICEDKSNLKYEINVVDILENPEVAEEIRILATPLLIKEYPKPSRRFVGDLSRLDLNLLL